MFLINIDTDSFRISSKQSITGVIYVSINGEYSFPEENWSDFIVVILSWWAEGIYSLLMTNTDECECIFMDGPYEFHIKKNVKVWEIEFLENRDEKRIIFQDSFNPSEVIEAMRKATNKVLRHCKEKGWDTSDVKKLADLYSKIAKAIG